MIPQNKVKFFRSLTTAPARDLLGGITRARFQLLCGPTALAEYLLGVELGILKHYLE